jgi:hypothetical protein
VERADLLAACLAACLVEDAKLSYRLVLATHSSQGGWRVRCRLWSGSVTQAAVSPLSKRRGRTAIMLQIAREDNAGGDKAELIRTAARPLGFRRVGADLKARLVQGLESTRCSAIQRSLDIRTPYGEESATYQRRPIAL